MDVDEYRKLALALSSTDLITAREARQQMLECFSPHRLVSTWSNVESTAIATALLEEVQESGDGDVYAVLGEAINTALMDSDTGPRLLSLDKSNVMVKFLLVAFSGEDLGLAARVRPAVISVLRSSEKSGRGEAIGHLFNDIFTNHSVLRFFDCDAVESQENDDVYRFISQHTTLIEYITRATTEAYETDPLLLANFLVVCGIVGRRERLPDHLLDRVHCALRENQDELAVAFTCRFCSIMLFQCEGNAAAFADNWVQSALNCLEKTDDESTVDAVFDVVGSSSSTLSGWRAVETHLRMDTVTQSVKARSLSLRVAALQLVKALLSSAHMSPSFIGDSILREAWQLRAAPDDSVRQVSWEIADRVVVHEVLRDIMAASYASYLTGPRHEDNANIRALHVRVADVLSEHGSFPDSTREALVRVRARGMYPPGSAGVEGMTKD